jgi:hypothetical protein
MSGYTDEEIAVLDAMDDYRGMGTDGEWTTNGRVAVKGVRSTAGEWGADFGKTIGKPLVDHVYALASVPMRRVTIGKRDPGVLPGPEVERSCSWCYGSGKTGDECSNCGHREPCDECGGTGRVMARGTEGKTGYCELASGSGELSAIDDRYASALIDGRGLVLWRASEGKANEATVFGYKDRDLVCVIMPMRTWGDKS